MAEREEDNSELEALKKTWEVERQELVRSERVQQQLQAVEQSLQRRCDDLKTDLTRLRDSAPLDEAAAALQQSIQAAESSCDAMRPELEEQRLEAERAELCTQECVTRSDAACKTLEETKVAIEALREAHRLAEAQHTHALEQARSMVSVEALRRAEADTLQLQEQVTEQEAETARLRQALMDSWASRTDEPLDFGDGGATDDAAEKRGAELKNLDSMEEELKWLAEAQQRSSAEVRRMAHLENSEAALHAQLKQLSEEKAALQSTLVDVGDTGRTMREAMASQSEDYVRKVGGLEDERRVADDDRKKLLQDCADMQARLSAMTPDLESIVAVEQKHRGLMVERDELNDQNQRLREINAVLGAQLLGGLDPAGINGDDGAAAMGEMLGQLVRLVRRFVERSGSHDLEKMKLADRIRTLEREAAQSGVAAVEERATAAPVAGRHVTARHRGADEAGGGSLAAATSVLKGGLGRLRDAALDRI